MSPSAPTVSSPNLPLLDRTGRLEKPISVRLFRVTIFVIFIAVQKVARTRQPTLFLASLSCHPLQVSRRRFSPHSHSPLIRTPASSRNLSSLTVCSVIKMLSERCILVWSMLARNQCMISCPHCTGNPRTLLSSIVFLCCRMSWGSIPVAGEAKAIEMPSLMQASAAFHRPDFHMAGP